MVSHASLLHRAVTSLNVAKVRELIGKGVDVNALEDGCTPLIKACAYGKAKGVKIAFLLIDHGCDVTYRTASRMSALEFSIHYGTPELITRLVEAGLPINGPRGITFTPAMEAARHGNLTNLKHLISLGADLKRKSPRGWAKGMNCLDIARHVKRRSVAAFLESIK